MKAGTTLTTGRLRIRNWGNTEADRAFFHRVNSDEEMMRFFPFRMNREDADRKLDELRAQAAATGFGWAVAEELETGRPVGFTGLAKTTGAQAAGHPQKPRPY